MSHCKCIYTINDLKSRIIDVSLYIYNSLYIIYIQLLYTPLTVAKKTNISTGHVKKYGVRKGRKERTKKKKKKKKTLRARAKENH